MVNMPEVLNCTALECFYNHKEVCHAPAITVGSGHPICDAYIERPGRLMSSASIGRVGACHMADCKFNEDLVCAAGSINVDYQLGRPDCVTYDPRPNVGEDADVALAEASPTVESSGSQARRLGPVE